MLKVVKGIIVLLCFFKGEAQSSGIMAADSLYATGNYTLAINEYSKIGSTRALLQIARSYSAIGNYDKAIAQYESVVGMDPTLHIASFELGKLYMKSRLFDEARKLFTKLVSNGNGNPEFYYYLGEAYTESGQPASSLVAYKNAVQLDSTHLRSLFRLGKYFLVKKQPDQALLYINKGLEFYSNDVGFVNLKALVYFNDNKYEEAIPWLEKVLELGEYKEYVYEKLAYSYYKNWEFGKAKKTYKELLKLNDQNSDTYFGLAEVYRKNMELDSAEVFINKAMIVKRPIFAKGYSLLASLYRERKDLRSAFKYYRMAHEENPEEPLLYYNICTVYDQLATEPEKKLEYYQSFKAQYGTRQPYLSEIVAKRISELKTEIHFTEE